MLERVLFSKSNARRKKDLKKDDEFISEKDHQAIDIILAEIDIYELFAFKHCKGRKDQSNGVSNLENVKCKLLHWEGTNLVVVEGQIASRDSKSKVHHVTLGPLCWKVWVNHVTVNVPLFRSTHEMYDLQDAVGSTVA
ncbi:unnamed protein product [Camellia sinensis]